VRRILALTAACAAAAVIFAATSLGGSTATPTLRGTVGPGFTISLTSGGKKITRLKPGTYRITVSDRSTLHNFVIEKERGTFERSITSVAFKGTMTWTLKLRAGKYTYVCDPHASGMKGSFRVT